MIDDPLDGFRRIANSDYDALEQELGAFRALAHDEEDLQALSLVLKRDALLRSLNEEAGPLRRLAAHATRVYEEACQRWVECEEAIHPVAIGAHNDARAARLVIDWIENEISTGNQAARQLESAGED